MYTPYLKEFIDLMQTCNYQKTAENMNISASSISKHIRKLEEECGGVALFERTTRSVVPTAYGVTFYDYAKQIVELEESGLLALKQLQEKNSSLLNIGYMPVMLEYELIDILMEFMQIYPEIEVKPIAGNRCSELFETEQCDFVFFDNHSQSELSLNHLLCTEDHLVALLPLDHPLANEKKITIEQLRNERFIMHGTSASSLCRDALTVHKMCKEVGFEPNIFLTSSHVSTIMGLVGKGTGISVLNRFLCPLALSSQVAIVDLEAPPSFRIYCLYRKNSLTSTQKLFLSFVREKSTDWPTHERNRLTGTTQNQW